MHSTFRISCSLSKMDISVPIIGNANDYMDSESYLKQLGLQLSNKDAVLSHVYNKLNRNPRYQEMRSIVSVLVQLDVMEESPQNSLSSCHADLSLMALETRFDEHMTVSKFKFKLDGQYVTWDIYDCPIVGPLKNSLPVTWHQALKMARSLINTSASNASNIELFTLIRHVFFHTSEALKELVSPTYQGHDSFEGSFMRKTFDSDDVYLDIDAIFSSIEYRLQQILPFLSNGQQAIQYEK